MTMFYTITEQQLKIIFFRIAALIFVFPIRLEPQVLCQFQAYVFQEANFALPSRKITDYSHFPTAYVA
jgi:hypothetical protein